MDFGSNDAAAFHLLHKVFTKGLNLFSHPRAESVNTHRKELGTQDTSDCPGTGTSRRQEGHDQQERKAWSHQQQVPCFRQGAVCQGRGAPPPQGHSNRDSLNTLNTPRAVGRLQDNHPNSSTHASVKCSLLDRGWAQQHTSNKQFRKGEGCGTAVGSRRAVFLPCGRTLVLL